MRLNELICRCRTDQSVHINYNNNRNVVGTVYDIIDTEEYRLNKIGDMLVIYISGFESSIFIKVVKA